MNTASSATLLLAIRPSHWVDDVGKAYPQITEASVKQVWRISAAAEPIRGRKLRSSRDQANLFLQFNYTVYGNRPDNFYFAMQFLKAAFATFVHGFDVNWVGEAEDVVRSAWRQATKNPMKLGPVALRRQIEGLCGILKEVTTGAPTHRSYRLRCSSAEDGGRCCGV